MATLLSDDFNRTTSTTVIGSPGTGGPWTNQNSAVSGIITNQGYLSTANTTGTGSHITAPGAVNVDMSVTFAAYGASQAQGICFRWVDASNMWAFAASSNGGYALYRITAGVYASQTSLPFLGVAGDVQRVVAYGENIWCFVNGRLVIHIKDPFYGNGASTIGIIARVNTCRFDTALAVDSADPWAGGFDFNPIKGSKTRTQDEGSDY